MVLVRCSDCARRPQAKFVWVSVAYFTAPGERLARKMRLCNGCFAERIGGYIVLRDPDDRLTCPSCGIDTEDDYEAVYGTYIAPGEAPEQLEIPFCSPCRNIFVEWAESRGESLEDRRRADSGPTTHPSGLDVLRSLGIQPRVR